MTLDLSDYNPNPTPEEINEATADGRATLSPTALAAYELCGRRGQYYQDQSIPRTSNEGTVRGRAWHAAMEWMVDTRVSLGDEAVFGHDRANLFSILHNAALTEFTAGVNGDEYVPKPDDDPIAAMAQIDVMIGAWLDADPSVRWHDPGVITPIAAELPLIGDYGSESHVCPGVMDAAFMVGSEVVGVDWKSAMRKWGGAKAAGDLRKLIQPPLYAESWNQQMTPQWPEMSWFAMDVMTVKGDFTRVWVPVGEAQRGPMLGRWVEVSHQIDAMKRAGLDFPTNPGNILCSEKWCGYWEVCPMGAQLDLVMPKGIND